jgi:RHS repeat-associated protein
LSSSEQGQVIWRASYKVWGNAIQEEWSGEYAQVDARTVARNIRFQGQYLDPETGLHYNTFRYYDPDVGRFTTPDPIGLAGGLNLYQYAPNPISWIDPWGWARNPANPNTAQRPNGWREHHTIPQEMLKDPAFKKRLTDIGIKQPKAFIDKQLVRIPAVEHDRLHSAGWNQDFKNWFRSNPNFTKRQLLDQVKAQMKLANVARSSRSGVRSYKRNGKCAF